MKSLLKNKGNCQQTKQAVSASIVKRTSGKLFPWTQLLEQLSGDEGKEVWKIPHNA